MKSAVFERQLGHTSTALETLATALAKFPHFAKLYMIQGQIHQSQGDHAAARTSFSAGLKACPKEVALWVLASRLEEVDGKSIKARALLERGRLLNPGSEALWLEAVGVEERSGGAPQAKAMLARALQDCSSSGTLWALAIWQESRPTRKSKSVDALKKSHDHPVVVCAVARLFWSEGKVEKARSWFERSVTADSSLGDSWGWWCKFEKEHGNQVSLYCPLRYGFCSWGWSHRSVVTRS
jgi:pre-mRNA-processing factor 6